MAGPAAPLPERVRALREEFDRALMEARGASALQSVRDRFLGRKSGAVTDLLKTLGSLTSWRRAWRRPRPAPPPTTAPASSPASVWTSRCRVVARRWGGAIR